MKVLILHPEFTDPGGISNYFAVLKDRLEIQNRHFSVGKRVGEKGFPSMFFRLFHDYVHFIKVLKSEDFDLVHMNVSLNFKGVARDGIFILLSKYYKKKVIVFFHGWEKNFERKVENRALWIFKNIYCRVNAFIVLAEEFKNKLHNWGFKQHVYVETTFVDDDILKDLDINEVIKIRRGDAKYKIFFLSRIIKEKGIYETIDAVNLLHHKYPNIELIIAGDGYELRNVMSYVKKTNVSNVIFTGYVRGKMKRKLFEDSYIYCFPSFYQEGMPISLLEAIAFGLPVITRPVGGIIDFFKNSKHGFITESKEPIVFANYIKNLISDKELYKKISLYNYNFAQERFLASKVVKKLERIYWEVLQS